MQWLRRDAHDRFLFPFDFDAIGVSGSLANQVPPG
jgi:hypothetical protein